jgi:hypothetical protein
MFDALKWHLVRVMVPLLCCHLSVWYKHVAHLLHFVLTHIQWFDALKWHLVRVMVPVLCCHLSVWYTHAAH